MMEHRTLHLMTQRDQPYGSVRRCCERCGLMLVARPEAFWEEHAYTTDEGAFMPTFADGIAFRTCDGRRPSARILQFDAPQAQLTTAASAPPQGAAAADPGTST